MSCEENNTCDEPIEIIQGSKSVFTVKILNDDKVGQDLAGVNEVWAGFQKSDNTYLQKKKSDSVDPIEVIAATSDIKITLSPSQTQTLKIGKNQDLFMVIEFPGSIGKQAIKVENKYNVVALPFTPA